MSSGSNKPAPDEGVADMTTEIALAERDAVLVAMRDLVAAFGRDMDHGFSTHAQQIALRAARSVLASFGVVP